MEVPTKARQVRTAITALERRRDHLAALVEARMRNDEPFQTEDAEYRATNSAIAVLVYHGLTLSSATSPILLIRELLDAVDRGDFNEVDALKVRGHHIISILT